MTTPHLAPNYTPLPVTLASGEGAWVRDASGTRYLDLLAAYSAVNFGHCHPALVAAAREQLGKLTLVSRAFDHDLLPPFAERLTRLMGAEMMLPMNTGAEAVETGIKAARKWGYEVRGVKADSATIIVASGNFHGRTTTIVSFSDDEGARKGFGPFTPGFRMVPYGNADALKAAIDDTVVAVLIEPIQGEAGVIIPPDGYLQAVREACTSAGVLFIADEIQSGLGRAGSLLACDLSNVRPDLVLLGKALGGGIMPVSAVVGKAEVLGRLTSGTHGSTFGGNPLACAVGLAVLDLLESGEYIERARTLGAWMKDRLNGFVSAGLLREVRSVGLWAGLDVDPALGTGRSVCEALLARRVLAKDTHGLTIRIAPPLVIEEADLAWAVDQLEEVLEGRRD